MSTNTGVAPSHGTTSAVAAKVKLGTNTASPGRMPQAISGRTSASVPLAQPRACFAWPKAGQRRLELAHLRTHDVGAAFDGSHQGGLDLAAETTALGLQVDEGNAHGDGLSQDGRAVEGGRGLACAAEERQTRGGHIALRRATRVPIHDVYLPELGSP